MTEELVVKVSEFSLEGRSWLKQPRVFDEASMRKFFCPTKELIFLRGGFSQKDLPKPWAIVCYAIMHFIMLEDRF